MTAELKIVAVAPRDGWAFVREHENIFLLRPPYTVSGKIECTMEEVEEAVLKHGFHNSDNSFPNYSELIRFVKNEYVRTNKESGINTPTIDELKQLLEYASEEVLSRFLNGAETELIPGGKIEAAESLALDLMKLDTVIGNKKLRDHALRIIDKCAASRKKKMDWETKFEEKRLNEKFINIIKRYPAAQIIETIRTIQGRGVLFPI